MTEKLTITFKDPDGVYESIREYVADSIAEAETPPPEDEADCLSECRRERITKQLEKWIEYGEYLTVEFDFEAGTATVKQNR